MTDMKRRDFLKAGAAAVVVTSTCLCGLNGCSTFTKIGHVNCRHNRARVFRRNGASSKCSKNSLGRFFQNGRFTSFFAFVFSVFRSLYFCCCGPDGVAR